jgi:hypothetical protein
MLKFTDAQGQKTLDKPENLVLDANFDTEAMVDPLFKQTTQRFDEMSLGSLLSSKLSINSQLLIQLDSQMPQVSHGEDSLGMGRHFEEMGLTGFLKDEDALPPQMLIC